MERKIIFGLSFVFVFFSWIPLGSAERIYLLDGRVINEKIISRTDSYIVTQSGQIPKKYYLGQIDRIEEDQPEDTIGDLKIDFQKFQSMGMSEVKAKLVVAMIKASGVYKTLQANIAHALTGVPEEQKGTYEALFNVDEITERLIPVYDKYYTEEDLRGIITFYESPIGKKVLEVTPEVVKESVGVSVKYFQEKVPSQ